MLQFFTVFSCEFVTFADGLGSAGIWFLGVDGACDEDQYETDDGLITGARSALIISMVAGLAAWGMVLFEWILCEVCCAGCLEGLAFAAGKRNQGLSKDTRILSLKVFLVIQHGWLVVRLSCFTAATYALVETSLLN